MPRWTLDDIAWERFDHSKVDPDIVRLMKAAALVEHNGEDYGVYLCNVFKDDPDFQSAASVWAAEEVQHGLALRRWCELADPDFDFDRAFQRFTEGYCLDLDTSESVRGSRAGELVARCIVETGTSSLYTALMESSEEPVLRAVCGHIAADEFRHYKLFYTHLRRYLDAEQLGRLRRLALAAGRMREAEDDELATAFWAANAGDQPYDRAAFSRECQRLSFRLYRPHHVDRGVAMIFKAAGIETQGWLARTASGLLWRFLDLRTRMLTRASA